MLWECLLLLALLHQGSLQRTEDETQQNGSDCTTKEEIAQLTRDVENIKHTTREWQNATIHVFRDYIIQQRELQRILEPLVSTIHATEQSLQDLRAEIQRSSQNTTVRLQEDIGNLQHATEQSLQNTTVRLQEDIGNLQHATERGLQDLKAEIQQVQRSLLHAENTTARLQEDVDNLKHGTDECTSEIELVRESLGDIPNSVEQVETTLTQFQQDALAELHLIRNVTLLHVGLPPGVFSSCSHVARENPTNPSGYYLVYNGVRRPTKVYCDMRTHCNISGGWMRGAFLNMTDPGHQCPPAWREITRSEEPRRTCGRTNETDQPRGGGCSSAVFPSNGIEYRHVYGRILGYQYGSPNAFNLYNDDNSTTIDSHYLDGVSVTHGNPRQHVWSFVATYSERQSSQYTCPCSNTANTATIAIPPYVGQDYFCETGSNLYGIAIVYPDDPLWDGENCGPTTTCCEFNNPPWFCKQLSEPTTDDIEVRICADQGINSNEDTPIELIEIYVQ